MSNDRTNRIQLIVRTDYGEKLTATLYRELDAEVAYLTLESAKVDGVNVPTEPPVVEPPPVDPPVEPPVTTLRIVSGNGQTAAPGSKITLVVELAGAAGPIANARISFTPTAGGGRFTNALPTYQQDTAVEAQKGRVALTGADGHASCDWVYGTGAQTAAVAAMDHGLDVAFTGTASSGSGGGGTQPPQTPGVLASVDFDNGSSAPFTVSGGGTQGNADINIIDDPTGQLSGKCARMRYARTNTAASVDVNRALSFNLPAAEKVGLGRTIFIAGDVLIPTPAANMAKAMRKLIYVQRDNNDASFCVIKANGNSLKAEITGSRLFSAGAFPFDHEVNIEVQITANSALGVADGVFRIWNDGTLALDRADIEWLTSTAPFAEIKIGQQTQHEQNDKTVLFDEFRYWDNLVVSTQRIGQ